MPGISSGSRESRARPLRAFRPEDLTIDGLERRTLMSAVPRSVLDSGRMIERVNVPYTTPAGTAERLNVYSPAGQPPAGGWPVIVAIHGGGWRRLDKTGYGDRIASAFVPNGYVVVAPNYVLSAPGRPSWPRNLEDVRAAVGWVRSSAAALRINPDQVVAMGESAGGNLAELLGTDPGPPGPGGVSTQVQAVIAFSAPSDLPALYVQSRWAGRAAAQFLGGTPQQVPQEFAAASPIDHVAPGDPPMFLVHGREDPLVPVDQSRMLAAALQGAGVPVQLVLVHGGHNLDFPIGAGQRNLIQPLLEFLGATWNDEGTLSIR